MIVFIYGIFEFLFQSNPIMDAISKSIPEEYAQGKIFLSDLDDTSRGGRARCQSLFSISILYGIASMLFCFFYFFITKYNNIFNIRKYFSFLVIVFVLFAQYACNSKTAIVALPVFILPWLIKNKVALFVDIIGIIIFLFFSNEIIDILSIFVDINAFNADDNQVSGSSLYLRLLQFEAGFEHWFNSFLFGNGIRSGEILSEKDYRLFGCESIWIRTMVEQGLLGIIAYIYLIITCLKRSLKCVNKWQIFFFVAGFFTICSITDIDYNLFFLLYITMLRIDNIESQQSLSLETQP